MSEVRHDGCHAPIERPSKRPTGADHQGAGPARPAPPAPKGHSGEPRSRALARAVEAIHKEADLETARFAQLTRLSCAPGCGACCEYPDIHVSLQDCLPAAWRLAERGEAEAFLERLQSEEGSPLCPFYTQIAPGRGRCSEYHTRPLPCRLFGFAARMNRSGQAELPLCSALAAQAEAPAAKALADHAPLFSSFGHRLSALDPSHPSDLMPIRRAFALAVQKALLEASLFQHETESQNV